MIPISDLRDQPPSMSNKHSKHTISSPSDSLHIVIRYSSPLIVIRQNGSSLSSSHSILGIWYLLACDDSLILLGTIGVCRPLGRFQREYARRGVIYTTQSLLSTQFKLFSAWTRGSPPEYRNKLGRHRYRLMPFFFSNTK